MAKRKKKKKPSNRFDLLMISKDFVRDPVLIMCTKQLFDFANHEGLKGRKLTDLQFEEEHRYTWVTCEEIVNE